MRRAALQRGPHFRRHIALGAMAETHIDPGFGLQLGDGGFAQHFHVHEDIRLALAFAQEAAEQCEQAAVQRERLRRMIGERSALMVETRPPGVLLPVLAGLGESVIGIPWMLFLAIGFAAIPCVGWFVAIACVLAAIAYPFRAIAKQFKVHRVRCPRCRRWYAVKRGETGTCRACSVYFVWTRDRRTAVAISSRLWL